MSKSKVTRGYGFLEVFLAKQRSKMADRLIPPAYRKGRILDIGCGTYPLFLMNARFFEKYGIDKAIKEGYSKEFQNQKITLIINDFENKDIMPFDNEYFDVVTMLAVIEHIEQEKLMKILKEVCRILKPGGMFIMTTPAFWTDGLLRFMAKLRLLSPVEIEDHKDIYSHSRISLMLQEVSFSKEKIKCGYFEMFMNMWVTGIK